MLTLREVLQASEARRKQLELSRAKEREEEAARQAAVNTPLIDRLRQLIASIPPEERDLPRKLEWFRERLRGRHRGKAPPGEIGIALRQLGWTPIRSWTISAPRGVLWHPPKSANK